MKDKIMEQMFLIKGNPIPLARPRFGRDHIYDSQKKEKYAYALQLRAQMKDKPLFEGPLLLTVEFGIKIPQKDHKKNSHPCIKRPDLSNLIKFIEDAALGILYKDDCIITEIRASKVCAIEPYTKLILSALLPSH